MALSGLVAGAFIAQSGSEIEPEIVVLDVGQGDCVLVREDGLTMLVDVGPGPDRRDTSSVSAAVSLRQLGVQRIDILFLTHPDTDHVGGLSELVKVAKVRRIVMAKTFESSSFVQVERQRPSLANTEWTFVESSANFSSLGWNVDVLAPPMSAESEDNSGSLFLRIAHRKSIFVISGDAPDYQEARVAESFDMRAQALMAGHHGSASSTSDPWLDAVQPSAVLVSAGRNNTYGHPSKSVLDRLRARGVPLFSTAKMGHLRLTPLSKGWAVSQPKPNQ